jgi:hypothetical protein
MTSTRPTLTAALAQRDGPKSTSLGRSDSGVEGACLERSTDRGRLPPGKAEMSSSPHDVPFEGAARVDDRRVLERHLPGRPANKPRTAVRARSGQRSLDDIDAERGSGSDLVTRLGRRATWPLTRPVEQPCPEQAGDVDAPRPREHRCICKLVDEPVADSPRQEGAFMRSQ